MFAIMAMMFQNGTVGTTTKSSCKKRFKVTASGRVKSGQAGKRHGMIKRSTKFIRTARGTTVMSTPDEKIIKSMMPYSR
jgi:large subunit ribosomal protein L35